jgi:excinuclease ABC subunit C
VNDVILLLQGNTGELVERMRRRMDAAAKNLAFEEAARYRDTIRALWKVSRQRVSEALQEDLDSDTWQVLTKMQEIFGLDTLPWRIDAFDISHMSGRETYGCCVVFEQGKPNPSLYRRFKIRSLAEGEVDDFRSMQETVLRRYRHVLDNTEPMPQFILIDGGPVQLEFAMKSLEELKADIPSTFRGTFAPPANPVVAALAKEEELVFRPGKTEPLRLPFDSPVLKFLQRIRDEVHRYAVTTHRSARTSRLRRSILEEIPGIGKTRAAQLLVKFGSVHRIAMMAPEEISGAGVGIGKTLAKKIIEHLRSDEKKL